ncbi:DNA polymerase-3 subunit epsilon [Nakamurella sp. UYEF19]|uniref:exonuclease domain-containing protein n=1 Tax=Nakamurella sp. UYEF19 TaxID=1756392 RepID=UPI003397647A
MSTVNPFAQGPAWHTGTLVGFDLETTGVDTTTDRVVTAAVVHVAPNGEVVRSREWLVDAGVRIPDAASAVHGVSTDRVRAHGMPSGLAIPEIIGELERAWCAGLPVVIFNAPYDLTLLDAEAVRSGVPRLSTRPWWPSAWVVDPLVIDRGMDRYRKGKRTLGATAEHYRVDARDAHSALGDAVAAATLARAIAAEHDLLRTADALTLHSAQVVWHHDWAVHLQAHLRSKGKSEAVIDRAWPLRVPVVGRHRAPETEAPPARVGRHRVPEPTAGEQARVTRAA